MGCNGKKNDSEYLRSLLSTVIDRRDLYDDENKLIREFKRKASIYTKTPEDKFYLEWLSLMRHYGAPVRILDCTYSFYVALYQAIKDAEGDCAIYAFNQKLFNDNISEYIIKNKKAISCIRNSSFELDNYIKTIFEKNRNPGVINVTPFRHNERISYQQGSFLMPLNIKLPFTDNLQINTQIYSNIYKEESYPVVKFILMYNSEERQKIIKELYRMNITGHSLNPNLDGFCETLRVCFKYP